MNSTRPKPRSKAKPARPSREELSARAVEWVTVVRGILDRLWNEADKMYEFAGEGQPLAGITCRLALRAFKEELLECDSRLIDLIAHCVEPSGVALPDVMGMVRRARGKAVAS